RLRHGQGLIAPPAISASGQHAWVQLLRGKSQVSSDANATGYQSSSNGVLLGLDLMPARGWRLGLASGYTRMSVSDGSGALADSTNYHLAIYGGRQSGSWAVRGGAGYSWHHLDTTRSVNYGRYSDRATASY